MEESRTTHFSNNSQDTSGCFFNDDTVLYYVSLMVICVGLFLTLMALIPMYSMIRKNPVAPVSVINLLISDLIQLCCLIIMVTSTDTSVCVLSCNIHYCALMVSVSFMVVISMERYLCVAWPMWFRFSQNIKNSVIISIAAWLIPVFYLIVYFYTLNYGYKILRSCYLLFPFPLLTFSLCKTIKVLSASHGVNSAEKMRIIFILSLVLLMYIVIFLPNVIYDFSETARDDRTFFNMSYSLQYSSPLADLVLYIFMRKDIFDRYLVSSCCCKMDQEEISRTVENVGTSSRQSIVDTERGITE